VGRTGDGQVVPVPVVFGVLSDLAFEQGRGPFEFLPLSLRRKVITVMENPDGNGPVTLVPPQLLVDDAFIAYGGLFRKTLTLLSIERLAPWLKRLMIVTVRASA